MNYINVGKIYTTHGLNGELKVKSNFKFKNQIYIKNMKFYFGDKKELNKLLSYRKQNEFDLLLFENLNDIDKVIKYRGIYLYIDRNDLNLEENSYLNSDLIGFKILFNSKEIGHLKDIFDAGNGNEIMNINDVLIPKNNNFIEKIDFNNKTIYLKNVEGLLKWK